MMQRMAHLRGGRGEEVRLSIQQAAELYHHSIRVMAPEYTHAPRKGSFVHACIGHMH